MNTSFEFGLIVLACAAGVFLVCLFREMWDSHNNRTVRLMSVVLAAFAVVAIVLLAASTAAKLKKTPDSLRFEAVGEVVTYGVATLEGHEYLMTKRGGVVHLVSCTNAACSVEAK